jgi:hypothetical protein
MGKPHPLALRERVVAFVEEGNTHRSSAAHSDINVRGAERLCENSAHSSKLADIAEISCSLIELRQDFRGTVQSAQPKLQCFRLFTQPPDEPD